MKLSELIVLAQLKLEQHGDLDLLTQDYWPVASLSHEISDGDFNEDWQMPKGFEYIMINDGR